MSRAPGAVLALVSRGEGSTSLDLVRPRDLPMKWAVGVSPRGGGAGEGVSPSPQVGTHTFLSGNPTPPALRAPPPPSPGGEGSHGDTRREAVPGAALTPVSEKGGEGWPGSGSSRGPIPGQWTVVAIANEGGDRGGGNPLPGQNDTRKFLSGTPRPLPDLCLVSSASRLNSYRLPSADNPLLEGGTVQGDTREKPCPGVQTPGQCETRSIS